MIEAASGGDAAAFRELIEPLARELGACAYRMLGAFQDAEDALQETRIKAWRHLATYEPRASFRAWVFRIATHTCLSLHPARGRGNPASNRWTFLGSGRGLGPWMYTPRSFR